MLDEPGAEAELASLHEHIEATRGDMNAIRGSVDELRDALLGDMDDPGMRAHIAAVAKEQRRLCAQIDGIAVVVRGNGDPGLCARVSRLERIIKTVAVPASLFGAAVLAGFGYALARYLTSG